MLGPPVARGVAAGARGRQAAGSIIDRMARRVGSMGHPDKNALREIAQARRAGVTGSISQHFGVAEGVEAASISKGRKRLAWGGAGVVGYNVIQRGRAPGGKSSGTTGLAPHSTGGMTMY